MELTWLKKFAEGWQNQTRAGRLPHAVLLQGPVGVGKRCAAAWMARRFLAMESAPALPEYPLVRPEHADLHWLSIPEDKLTVGIEQIRGLVDAMRLTSYAGGGKVAVIDPATAMTLSAANSLLKTLEEPPGDALMILIADRAARLPATVLSRCQRISMPPPADSESLQWLDRLKPGADWSVALRAAGNAPLAAIQVIEQLADIDEMASDFAALGEGSAAPLEVAARWTRHDAEFVLSWLSREVRNMVYRASGCRNRGAYPQPDESVPRRIDTRNLFCYLDIINRVRGQNPGSFNLQLTLESLLIDWAEGLADCRSE